MCREISCVRCREEAEEVKFSRRRKEGEEEKVYKKQPAAQQQFYYHPPPLLLLVIEPNSQPASWEEKPEVIKPGFRWRLRGKNNSRFIIDGKIFFEQNLECLESQLNLWPNPSTTCNFVVQVAGGAWYGAIAHHLFRNNFRESQSLECSIVRFNWTFGAGKWREQLNWQSIVYILGSDLADR